MTNRLAVPLILCFLMALQSCVRPSGDILLANVDNSGWSRDNASYIYYDNNDTVALRSLKLIVRQTDLFRYDRFVFSVETLTPDNRFFTDTVSVVTKNLLDPGLAPGAVTYEDIEVVYKDKVNFNRDGKYRFRFSHLMPDSLLTGITGIGLRIE